jgi:hypothetical protein
MIWAACTGWSHCSSNQPFCAPRTAQSPLSWFAASAAAVLLAAAACAAELPENLAPRAQVAASSQFSDAYRPQMAISGIVPSEFQQDRAAGNGDRSTNGILTTSIAFSSIRSGWN